MARSPGKEIRVIMQKIHVRRYARPCGWEGFIEPEDRSWIVFIDDGGEPHLYKRVEYGDDDGTIKHGYVDVEHVSGVVPDIPDNVPSEEQPPQVWPGPLTCHVESYELCEEEREDRRKRGRPDATVGWRAWFDQRDIIYVGDSESEVIDAMVNGVAQLCSAGCMDHTGQPSMLIGEAHRKRYERVFGKQKWGASDKPPVPEVETEKAQ